MRAKLLYKELLTNPPDYICMGDETYIKWICLHCQVHSIVQVSIKVLENAEKSIQIEKFGLSLASNLPVWIEKYSNLSQRYNHCR